MNSLKEIKEQLVIQVQNQMGNLECVNTKELGEVIDMIKDLSKAIYYCEVSKQMEEADESRKMGKWEDHSQSFNMGSGQGEVAASHNPTRSINNSHDSEGNDSVYLRDEREGRSPITRKIYMESKMMGHDSTKTIKELESYIQDLTSDMMELLGKASPEEKSMIQKKINTLAAKVQNV